MEKINTKQEESVCGDGGAWLRGPLVGRGSFGDVHVAYFPGPSLLKRFLGFPSVVAVKSTDSWAELKAEKKVYEALGPSPFLLRCFGDDVTLAADDFTLLLNVFLEYASGGTLERLILNSKGTGLLEPQVRAFTRSILGGINHIHNKGFVHCDLHSGNILLVKEHTGFVAKIGDFGLAKREAQGRASDIWALGCIVFAMLTGMLAWKRAPKIASMAERGVSDEARDFVRKCLAADPSDRPSAASLLDHPFVSECLHGEDEQDRKTGDRKKQLLLHRLVASLRRLL